VIAASALNALIRVLGLRAPIAPIVSLAPIAAALPR